jgi:3D (Asp-Asp-Asp) domain-containing protein
MGIKSRSLHDIAEELAARLDAPASGGHDVSNEPRVPKGNGQQSGEWTDGAAGANADNADGRRDPGCPNGSYVVPMIVTAYTNGPESTGKRLGDPDYGVTGRRHKHGPKIFAGPGTIAAPEEYALDTRMFVPGYGWGTVQDTGGAIKGNRLDVWFETVEEARQWGRRHLNVTVCK